MQEQQLYPFLSSRRWKSTSDYSSDPHRGWRRSAQGFSALTLPLSRGISSDLIRTPSSLGSGKQTEYGIHLCFIFSRVSLSVHRISNLTIVQYQHAVQRQILLHPSQLAGASAGRSRFHSTSSQVNDKLRPLITSASTTQQPWPRPSPKA